MRATPKSTPMWRVACLVIIVLSAAWSVYGTFFASGTHGDWGVSTPVGLSSDTRVFPVRHVEPGSPAARAGIVVGDRLRALVPHAFPVIFPASATRIDFEVTHGASRRTVTLVAATRLAHRHPTELILFVAELAWLGLALLLIWRRWNDRDARPLILSFICSAVTMAAGFAFQSTGVFALPAFYLVNLLGIAALIRFTAIYPSNRPASRVRRTFAIVAPLLALACGVVFAAWSLSFEWLNVEFLTYATYRYTELVMLWVFPAIGLLMGLLSSTGADRRRLALLLGFFVVGESGPIAYLILVAAKGPAYDGIARPLLATLIVSALGFVYLILRERLFDVSFVLNRTAVYAAITTLLAPILLVAEWLAQRILTGGDRAENALVQVGIALLLFVVARQLYDRIDHAVDRLLFRERHENEHALLSFVRRVALLDNMQAISEQTVHTVCAHTEAVYGALYRRDQNGDFTPTSHEGDFDFPAIVGRNDPAVLALRADRSPIENLRGSTFTGALVLPMIGARGLGEFLVCGPKRSGETYAPDEREALLQLAHGTAVALDAVHISELEKENARFRAALQPAT
jgi:hypothetical protein